MDSSDKLGNAVRSSLATTLRPGTRRFIGESLRISRRLCSVRVFVSLSAPAGLLNESNFIARPTVADHFWFQVFRSFRERRIDSRRYLPLSMWIQGCRFCDIGRIQGFHHFDLTNAARRTSNYLVEFDTGTFWNCHGESLTRFVVKPEAFGCVR